MLSEHLLRERLHELIILKDTLKAPRQEIRERESVDRWGYTGDQIAELERFFTITLLKVSPEEKIAQGEWSSLELRMKKLEDSVLGIFVVVQVTTESIQDLGATVNCGWKAA